MSFPSRRGSFREGSLDQYLKEISQYPLIDKAEEVRLAKGIRRGEEEALNKLVRSIGYSRSGLLCPMTCLSLVFQRDPM